MGFSELPLTHYCEPGRTPFLSVTALPRGEAMKKAAELAPDTRSPKNRFCAEDFPGYYEKRLRTEAWLYRAFLEKGGRPQTPHPLYFVLGGSGYLHRWFGSGPSYTLDMRDVPREALSFTLGDSMSVVDRTGRDVFTPDEMAGRLAVLDLPAVLEEAGIHYVEAQLWMEKPPRLCF